MIKASDLRKGKLILYNNELWTVHSSQHVSKGNWRSYIQARLKNLRTGQLVETRFAVDESIETPFVETRPFEYLYRDGDDFVLMDQSTYDQVHVPKDIMGDGELYLKGNETVTCMIIDAKIVGVELPNVVELAVVDTPPAIRGATVTSQSKEAVLETGLRIKVPSFIENGEVVRVDTRTGEYVERAKG